MSKHFKSYEFGCSCCGIYIVNYHLQAVLEMVRAHFGQPVIISSGTRCKAHNKKENGYPRSRHLTGEAADIVVKNTEAIKVYEYLNEMFPYTLGIGKYEGFTHVDVREKHARWVG